MNKTISILLITLLLMSMTVIAVEKESNEIKENNRVEIKVKGLENAMIKVKNNETSEHLNEVLMKIQEKRTEQLAKLEGLTFEENEDGTIKAEGVGESKFLGLFKVKRNKNFVINEDGSVERVKKTFDVLFTEKEE